MARLSPLDPQAYQPSIEHTPLLPAPDGKLLYKLAGMSRECVLAHAGRVASRAGGLRLAAPPDAEGDLYVQGRVRGQRFVVVGFVADDEGGGQNIVGDAGLDWDDEEDPPVAVIQLDFNRRYDATTFLSLGFMAFCEVYETLAHEIAHAIDKEHTMAEPQYAGSKGKKHEHDYVFAQTEVRARVWAGLAFYSYFYVLQAVSERWPDEPLPTRDASDEQWDAWIEASPLSDVPLDEMNLDNRALFVPMLREAACDALEETRAAMRSGKAPPPFAVFPVQDAEAMGGFSVGRRRHGRPATKEEIVQASEALAEVCLREWIEKVD